MLRTSESLAKTPASNSHQNPHTPVRISRFSQKNGLMLEVLSPDIEHHRRTDPSAATRTPDESPIEAIPEMIVSDHPGHHATVLATQLSKNPSTDLTDGSRALAAMRVVMLSEAVEMDKRDAESPVEYEDDFESASEDAEAPTKADAYEADFESESKDDETKDPDDSNPVMNPSDSRKQSIPAPVSRAKDPSDDDVVVMETMSGMDYSLSVMTPREDHASSSRTPESSDPIDLISISRFEKTRLGNHTKLLRNDKGDIITIHYTQFSPDGPNPILGKGRFGRVKLVEIEGKEYARKQIPKRQYPAKDTDIEHTALREFKAHVFFQDNPHFLKPIAFYSTKNFHVFVMEKAQCSLQEHADTLRGRASNPDPKFRHELQPLAIQFLQAIQYMHAQKLLHCDIKPQNMLLGHDGLVKVGDLGTVKMADDPNVETLVGTPCYIAPEILESQRHTMESEAFACGATLYSLFFHQPLIRLFKPAAPQAAAAPKKRTPPKLDSEAEFSELSPKFQEALKAEGLANSNGFLSKASSADESSASCESQIPIENSISLLAKFDPSNYRKMYNEYLSSAASTPKDPILQIILGLVHPDPAARLTIPDALTRLREI